jgi:D-beta-D-heptose 7-phosphate kinase/D-beta-D-heptose 1-phosphate adenosyltransferase
LSVLLLGDACIDVYHYGRCDRISPEAPVPVFLEEETETRMGMSLNVYLNLLAFELKTECIVGESYIEKHRYIDSRSKQHLLRVDRNESDQLGACFRFDSRILGDIDLVVISDYDKGFLTPDQCLSLSKYCYDNNIPVFVDSKKTDLSCFENCIIKINQHEYEKITKYPRELDLIVTLGADGVLYKGDIYKTDEVEVFDVCGAGDVFISSLVYMYLKHGDMIKAIEFANKCAAYSVTKFGTYVLTKEDVDDLCV